jgi:hypothetical protein
MTIPSPQPKKPLDSLIDTVLPFNPQQLKVKDMNEFEQASITRAIDALEAIAEHMGVLATMAMANASTTTVAKAFEANPSAATFGVLAATANATAKRKGGRPRKDSVVHSADEEPVRAATAVAESAEPAEATQEAPAEPTEDERRAKFDELKSALKGALALHGEAATRERLQYAKFSEVPYEAIDATIERLAA